MVMIIGHRGARNLWPENSLSGFRKLLALGVDAVEFDVHQTRDGQLVVIHDALLERTTFGRGAIRDLTAAEVTSSRLRPVPEPGDTDESVPTLEAVLAVFRDSPLELHVEIKTNAVGELAPDTIARVIDAVRDHDLEHRAVLTCFVPEVLEHVRRLWPRARVLASLDLRSAEMLGGIERALARYAALDDCIVAVEKNLLAASWSRCLAVLGSERLGAWVLNEPAEFDRWMPLPMRQITTDRPDLALAARERLKRQPMRLA